MTAKMYKIWLFVLVGALALSLFGAAITYGRYGSNPSISEDSLYGDIIDFIGAEKYIVRTPEELTAAIENGYSYIEIAEDAEQPFEVTTGVTDVEANLVIDINGNDVIRNSRNPLLNVQENVSVVIVFDSESETAGSFYNPVGSSLQVAGGTLTIAAGTYDCGPRTGEKVTVSGSNYTTTDGGSFALNDDTQSVKSVTLTLHLRNGYGTNGDYSSTNLRQTGYTTTTANMPVITPNTTGGVNGNMYFADGSLQGTTQGYNTYIKGDTFLVYGVSDVADPQPLCDAASCDFYYSYPIGDDNYNYNADGTRYAVVYGYNDVMDGATAQISATDTSGGAVTSQVVWPYAAIRMESGEAFARGGNYENHFGTANSYGIYAEGGNLVVSGSSAFTAVGDGVCIHCKKNTTSGTAANLAVTGGSFTSERGDTVQVEGGTLYASGGTFTKSASAASGNSAIVRMTGGTFTGPASGSSHITMTAGASNNILDQVFGIYSVGGTVELYRADITLHGTYGAGVLATASAEASASAPSVLLDGCKITVADSIYNSQYLSSTAVSSQGGNITFTGTNTIASDSLGITAAGGSTREGEQVVVQSGATTVTTENGTGVYVYGGSLAVEKGATLSVEATIPGIEDDPNTGWSDEEDLTSARYTWPPQESGDGTSTDITRYDGIAIDGGSLRADGALNVKFIGLENKDEAIDFNNLSNVSSASTSYAVRVQGGAGGDATVKIVSGTITTNVITVEGWFTQEQQQGGGGVYVANGTVELGVSNDGTSSGPTVQTLGTRLYNEDGHDRYNVTGLTEGTWQYYANRNGGPAIEVAGGTLYVYGGSYTSAQGDGILVRDGTAEISGGTFSGDDTYDANGGGFVTGAGASYAFKLYGGTANISGGRFESAGGGAFVMGGTRTGNEEEDDKVTVTGGIFAADGPSGFSVWRNATLIFGDETKSEEVNNANLIVAAASTGIAVENQSINANNAAEITIHGGIFSGGSYTGNGVTITGGGDNRNGIWYGTSWSKITIDGGQIIGDHNGFDFAGGGNANAAEGTIRISGGTIIGEGSNGFDYVGGTGNSSAAAGMIQISGGTITGNQNGFYFAKGGTDYNAYGIIQISGGTFEGETRSGLFFNDNQWIDDLGNSTFKISGGTFKGVPSHSYSNVYHYGAIGTNDDILGYNIKIHDLVPNGYDASCQTVVYYYDNRNDSWNDGTWTISELDAEDVRLYNSTAACSQVTFVTTVTTP